MNGPKKSNHLTLSLVGYFANQKIYGTIILIIGPLKAKDIKLVRKSQQDL
jgi:hypothetical protein